MTRKKGVIVTGSTSGIGLGMAKAFAKDGMNVMLNGFGDADEIESIRSQLASGHGVEAGYHGADMTKPDVLLDAQPTKKFVTTEEIGALAAFLCSDAAASITGAALPIDGGWTAQ